VAASRGAAKGTQGGGWCVSLVALPLSFVRSVVCAERGWGGGEEGWGSGRGGGGGGAGGVSGALEEVVWMLQRYGGNYFSKVLCTSLYLVM
jgi:hypothetical protein